jgi:hypothetical protein
MPKYKGPPKPIPTHREPMSDSTLALWFAALAAFLAIILYLE